MATPGRVILPVSSGWGRRMEPSFFYIFLVFRIVNVLLEKLAVGRNGGKTVKEGVEGRGWEGQGGDGRADLDHFRQDSYAASLLQKAKRQPGANGQCCKLFHQAIFQFISYLLLTSHILHKRVSLGPSFLLSTYPPFVRGVCLHPCVL